MPRQPRADAPQASRRGGAGDGAARSYEAAAGSGGGEGQDETGDDSSDVTSGSGSHGGDGGRGDEAAWEDILDIPGSKQAHLDSAGGIASDTASDTVAPEDGSDPGPDTTEATFQAGAPVAEHASKVPSTPQLMFVTALQTSMAVLLK